MNIKECFRYQKFLDSLMSSACDSIQSYEHCLNTTKTHKRSLANPEADDVTESVERSGTFFPNDAVIALMVWLVNERSVLTNAIEKAKSSVGFSIDSAVETNKFRHMVSRSIKSMLGYTSSKSTQKGSAYKFNVEGNQVAYFYDIDVVNEEAYDRDNAKKIMKQMISDADRVSSEIEAALVTTTVDYTPVYDVNDSFEDVMSEFIDKYYQPSK